MPPFPARRLKIRAGTGKPSTYHDGAELLCQEKAQKIRLALRLSLCGKNWA